MFEGPNLQDLQDLNSRLCALFIYSSHLNYTKKLLSQTQHFFINNHLPPGASLDFSEIMLSQYTINDKYKYY